MSQHLTLQNMLSYWQKQKVAHQHEDQAGRHCIWHGSVRLILSFAVPCMVCSVDFAVNR
jgi:hypothetical protein